ncbi:uncharacterized protein N7496_003801, partial [Penicillium cataractarum]
TTEIVSLDLLAIDINEFLSSWEISHLRDLATVLSFQRAIFRDKEGKFTHHEDKYHDHKPHTARRIASSLYLPSDDLVVDCIIKRSTDFVVKYREGGDIHERHYDWFLSPPRIASGLKCNRAAIFFVYLGDEPEGGETCFHFLQR